MVGVGDGAQGSAVRHTLSLINSEPTTKPSFSESGGKLLSLRRAQLVLPPLRMCPGHCQLL